MVHPFPGFVLFCFFFQIIIEVSELLFNEEK